MIKRLLAVALLLVASTAATALDIDQKHRVPNQQPGYCCWASLETLGRTHNITELHDLVESRKKEPDGLLQYGPNSYIVQPKNYGYDSALRAKLTDLKVKFWMENTGNTDRTLLKYADSHGCMTGLKAGARGDGAHAVVLTHYDDKIVRFYDCNNPKDMWEGSRQWFDYWWSGSVIVVEK